jgi:hypothetical protein
MYNWILNIVGMIFVGVILDVVLPNGKTNTLIKTIFGIFILYVIVSPLPKIFNHNISLTNNNSTIIDQNYLINVNLSKLTELENEITTTLSKNGFDNVSVVVDANIYSEQLIINKVYVDVVNLVLNSGGKHINIYKDITNLIIAITNIKEEEIIFYG